MVFCNGEAVQWVPVMTQMTDKRTRTRLTIISDWLFINRVCFINLPSLTPDASNILKAVIPSKTPGMDSEQMCTAGMLYFL